MSELKLMSISGVSGVVERSTNSATGSASSSIPADK